MTRMRFPAYLQTLLVICSSLFVTVGALPPARAVQDAEETQAVRDEATADVLTAFLGRERGDHADLSAAEASRIANGWSFIQTYDAELERILSGNDEAQTPPALPELNDEGEELARLILTARLEAEIDATFEPGQREIAELPDRIAGIVDLVVQAAGLPARPSRALLAQALDARHELFVQMELAGIPDERAAFERMPPDRQEDVRNEIIGQIRNMLQIQTLGLSQTRHYTTQQFMRGLEVESARADAILGVDHERSILALDVYSLLLVENGELESALEVKREILTRRQRVFGPDSDEVANAEGGLAWVLGANGQFVEADELIERLQTREWTRQESIETLLLQHYVRAGLTDRVDALLQEVDVNRLTMFCGPISEALIQHYLQSEAYSDAFELARRNLDSCSEWHGNDGFTNLLLIDAFVSLTEVALALVSDPETHPVYEAGRPTFLERLPALVEHADYIQALNDTRLDSDHPLLLRAHASAAGLLAYTGQWTESDERFELALERAEARFGASHPLTLNILRQFTNVQVDLGLTRRSRPKINRVIENSLRETAHDLGQRSLSRNSDGSENQISGQARQSLSIARDALFRRENTDLDRAAITDAAFVITQAFSASSAADALEASSARLGISDPRLQQILDRRRAAETEMVSARARLFGLRSAPVRHEERLAQAEIDLALALEELVEANSALDAFDPEVAALIARRATGARDVQTLLQPNEALITYSFSSDDNRLIAFVLTRERVVLHALETDIETVRSRADRLREALEVPPSTDALRHQVFDLDAGLALYHDIFEPLQQYLDGKSQILVVSDGPLDFLPLHVLPIERPDDWTGTFDDYRATGWLSETYAFARLPAVSSLGALRRGGQTNARGVQPLLGFADPLLSRQIEAEGGAVTEPVFEDDLLLSLSGNGAGALSDLPAVPQTRQLLERLAETLRADSSDLYFAENAQESRIHRLNSEGVLADYQNIAFATHALIDGAEAGIDELLEPALVLTPPTGNRLPFNNDGLLRASEIVGLRLDAEFIILAACNTAAPDGSSGSEALSGLVKAFFFAGARSILVSNWPAEASATAILSSRLVENMVVRDESRAVALQSAMRHLRENEAEHFSHPALWAPFMVVSDG